MRTRHGRRTRQAGRRSSRSRRAIGFRLAAIATGLLPFVVAEAILTIAGIGDPDAIKDPFCGIRGSRPLFERDAGGGPYRIAAGRLEFFHPESFAATKAPGAFRIFCLGGSTVQGRPYAPQTAFSTWLRIALECAEPARRFEVINCGGISYAAYRTVPILEEVLDYEPDLIVLCTGHNEFLEDRTYTHLKRLPDAVVRPLGALVRTRTFGALATLLRPPTPDRPELAAETSPRLNHPGGLDAYHRDPVWRRTVIAHFRHSLARMVALCARAEVPLIVVDPPENLRDCPPFKSEHRPDLTVAERERWESLVRSGIAADRADEALRLYTEATAIDAEHALLHFRLGRANDALGRHAAAKAAYLRAKELDVCPLRMLEPMHAALHDVARRTGTPVVDARSLLATQARDGILGDDWLVDHVHPSVKGHQRIGLALLEAISRLGMVTLPPDAAPSREQRFCEHLAGLDSLYFPHAQRTLERLRLWAAGRVEVR